MNPYLEAKIPWKVATAALLSSFVLAALIVPISDSFVAGLVSATSIVVALSLSVILFITSPSSEIEPTQDDLEGQNQKSFDQRVSTIVLARGKVFLYLSSLLLLFLILSLEDWEGSLVERLVTIAQEAMSVGLKEHSAASLTMLVRTVSYVTDTLVVILFVLSCFAFFATAREAFGRIRTE